MAQGLTSGGGAAGPGGQGAGGFTRPNGLKIRKVSVPRGWWPLSLIPAQCNGGHGGCVRQERGDPEAATPYLNKALTRVLGYRNGIARLCSWWKILRGRPQAA